MIELFKKHDIEYFIDDLNYLTIKKDEAVLCAYFPDTDPKENFCYIFLGGPGAYRYCNHEDENNLLAPNFAYISCRDLEILKKFIELFNKHTAPLHLSINIPASFDQTDAFMTNFDLYQKHKTLYDMRFETPLKMNGSKEYHVTKSGKAEVKLLRDLLSVNNDSDTDYWIENFIYQIVNNENHHIWTLYKNDDPVFTYDSSPWRIFTKNGIITSEDRIGAKIVSFSDMYVLFRTPTEDELLYFLKYISSYYKKYGFIVKNICIDDEKSIFETEELCQKIGMTPYRKFITYRNKNLKNKKRAT